MQRTNIAYLTHTWNPLAMRCTPVSEACLNCWHIGMAKRHAANPHFTEDERAAYAGHNIVLREKELEAPLRRRKPARIGVQFMGDLFLEGVGYHWQERIWDVMEKAKQHTFLVLTKRVDLMEQALDSLVVSHGVLPNVWPGTTVENQKRADERIPTLLRCRAAGYWVSLEPLLGAVNLLRWTRGPGLCDVCAGTGQGIGDTDCPACFGTAYVNSPPLLDWVICGGETGAGARWMDNDWAREARDQCYEVGVPFFMKQVSGKAPIPADLMVRQYPKGMIQ